MSGNSSATRRIAAVKKETAGNDPQILSVDGKHHSDPATILLELASKEETLDGLERGMEHDRPRDRVLSTRVL